MQGDLPLKKTQEKRFGNSMLYATTAKATKPDYHFVVEYDVVRLERNDLSEALRQASEQPGPTGAFVKPTAYDRSVRRYLAADKLVPVTGLPAQLASQTVAGKTGELQQARAIYDYVLANMKYDKKGTGWDAAIPFGHATRSVATAPTSTRSSCPWHAHKAFRHASRSAFPSPPRKPAAKIPGYHCWSEFYLNGKGWVAVDISEAWKNQAKKDYYFGSYDPNRVQFTLGRDIVLSPAQAGEPLNYFIYPYVEVSGKKYDNVLNAFSFADVSAPSQSVAANASGK